MTVRVAAGLANEQVFRDDCRALLISRALEVAAEPGDGTPEQFAELRWAHSLLNVGPVEFEQLLDRVCWAMAAGALPDGVRHGPPVPAALGHTPERERQMAERMREIVTQFAGGRFHAAQAGVQR